MRKNWRCLIRDLIGKNKLGFVELYGPAGSGKTAISLACALNCIENEGKVLLFHTEGDGLEKRLKRMIHEEDRLNMEGLFIGRINSFTQQAKIFNRLDTLCEAVNPDLIIIDSLTRMYRLAASKSKKDMKINLELNREFAILARLGERRGIDIITTATVVGMGGEGYRPSGGKASLEWPQYIIELSREGDQHIARLIKGDRRLVGVTIRFKVTERGVEPCRQNEEGYNEC